MNRCALPFLLPLLSTTALAGAASFDDAPVGNAPVGWTATSTGQGEAIWSVEKDDTAPSPPHVLKQSGRATFPVCIKSDTRLKDGFVQVKFKPVSGKEDQAGGVLWRCKDADNYYIARANALEDNVTIYHTVGGRRVAFKSVDTNVASNAWHTLRVDFTGDRFTVNFDGTKVIEARDDTFTDAGAVGVWTKADSVTLFDDFTYGESVDAAAAPLTLERSIELPGVEGRFDHAAIDLTTQRLFVAALGNDTLEVVDLAQGKRLHTIHGLSKPTGVLYLADLNLLVVAGGDDGTCRFYDGTSYAEKGRVTEVEDADNLRYDAREHRVYLGYGAGALGVIDPATMKLVASIPLAKHPEAFQLEQDGRRIFVNVPDARQIAVVDRVARRVIASWPVEEFGENFPMSLDEARHRLFVGCRAPARLLAFDTETGARVADAPLGGDIDDLFLDSASSRLLAACGEGGVDLFIFAPPAQLVRTHSFPTAAGARTALFSAKLGMLYVAVPHRGAQGAAIRAYRLSAR
jgi:hypothetical protein